MHERFLSSVFRSAIVLVAAAPVAACGGQVATGESSDAESHDSETTNDGLPAEDTGAPVDVVIDDVPPPPPPTCDTIGKPKETDPLPPCGYQLSIAGDPNACGFNPTTHQGTPDLCHKLCGHTSISYCYLNPETATTPAYVECGGFCEGRRPDALDPCAPRGETVGRWLAQVAYLEAASIDAFRVLRAELRAHRAPKRLLRAASRAKRDEVRHARATRALARRYGGVAAPPNVQPMRTRSLEEIAVENAIEGCVRETFGALVATYRATNAKDEVVRAEMRRIARDETRHAALAWAIARWIRPRLDAAARERVDAAQSRAVDGLRNEIGAVDAEVVRQTGSPDADRAIALLDAVANRLWS